MSILVLGVGNILLADEGVGVRAVEALATRYHLPDTVEVVTAAPLALTCSICWTAETPSSWSMRSGRRILPAL